MPRLVTVPILTLCLVPFLVAQSDSAASQAPAVTPETGFVSPEKYTNAFFGFCLPLPHDPALRELTLPFKGDNSRHFLFGLQSWKVSDGFFSGPSAKGAAFTVTAKQSIDASPDDVRKAASGLKGRTATQIKIGGREFWRSDSQEKLSAGKLHSVAFATALNGYILQFNIESFDEQLMRKLQQGIEAITFFDPIKASEMAGPGSLAYNPAAQHDRGGAAAPSSRRVGQLNPGVISGNTYKNDELGIEYQFPEGWVVSDKATQDRVIQAGHEFAWGNSLEAAREHQAFQQCTKILLWTTRYPEGVKTEEVNPLIVLMALDPECSAGARFPTSANDRDAVRLVAQQIVRSFAGSPFMPKEKPSASTFTAQGHLMIAISNSFVVHAPGRGAPLDVFTSFILTALKDYWIAWELMSGSQSGLRGLGKTQITFRSAGAAAPADDTKR